MQGWRQLTGRRSALIATLSLLALACDGPSAPPSRPPSAEDSARVVVDETAPPTVGIHVVYRNRSALDLRCQANIIWGDPHLPADYPREQVAEFEVPAGAGVGVLFRRVYDDDPASQGPTNWSYMLARYEGMKSDRVYLCCAAATEEHIEGCPSAS